MTTDEPHLPQFSVWLGDGWPGPYVVEITKTRGGRPTVVVVHGAADMADAARRACDAIPGLEGGVELRVTNAQEVLTDGTVSTPHVCGFRWDDRRRPVARRHPGGQHTCSNPNNKHPHHCECGAKR